MSTPHPIGMQEIPDQDQFFMKLKIAREEAEDNVRAKMTLWSKVMKITAAFGLIFYPVQTVGASHRWMTISLAWLNRMNILSLPTHHSPHHPGSQGSELRTMLTYVTIWLS